jgi:hypothetical protein
VHFCLQPYTLFTLILPLHIIYFLHLLSTNHKCTQPCYFRCHSNLLLRRRRWTEILQRGVLGCALPRLLFLWSFRVFRCSISLESCLVFKDILYVINILYSWHLVICEHFLSICVEQLILGIRTMSTCFCLQNRVWHFESVGFVEVHHPVIR